MADDKKRKKKEDEPKHEELDKANASKEEQVDASPEAERQPEPQAAAEEAPESEPEPEVAEGLETEDAKDPEPGLATEDEPQLEADVEGKAEDEPGKAKAAKDEPGKAKGARDERGKAKAAKDEPPGAHLDPIVVEPGKKREETEEELAARYAMEAMEAEEELDVEEPGEAKAPEEPQITVTPVQIDAAAVYRATGKRKNSTARVAIRAGQGVVSINRRSLEEYFPRTALQQAVLAPLQIAGVQDKMDLSARVHGGGISGQAQAVRHGVARALVEADDGVRGVLKRKGLLTRDARVKERRKAGLKKARKRPQFSKR